MQTTMATRTSKIPTLNRIAALVLIAAALLPAVAATGYAGVNEWVTNGPSGAIVYSLGVSPDYATSKTVFAGTDNGIYKSTNGGTSWTQGGLAGNHAQSLAVSPGYAADGTVFSGTNNAGIYKSTNGGTSWTQVGLAGTSVSALAISNNYATDRTVFAGTNGGVYKSTDAGTSWTAMNTRFSHNYISAIQTSPNYTIDGTVFAGTSDGGGVYKSMDGGASWARVNNDLGNINISSLGVSPNYAVDGTVFAGASDGGGVYKTINGGASWTQSGLLGVNIFSLATSPNYADDSTTVVGTYGGGAHISTNGGTNWTQINTGLAPTSIPSVRFSPAYGSDYTIFAGTWGGGVFSATTSDSLPPVINSADPANGATAIARDKTIAITFNENVQSSTAYDLITLKDAAGSQVTMTKVINGRVLTLDPTGDLAYGTTYTAIIPAGAVKDTANNAFGAQHTLSFTVAAAPDTTPPTVSSTDPANSALSITRDKTVVITFSENIQAGSAYNNITFKTAAGVSVDATKTVSGATLSLDPAGDLAGNTVHTITIPVNAVKDMSNNNLAAQYALSFTTQNDTTPPTVSSTDPANNAVEVAKEKTITITFSENILAGTAYETIAVKDTSSTAISLSKNIKDKVLTLTPAKDLALGMKYTVTIPASGVKDSAGNALAAAYSFNITTQNDTTTATAPQGLKVVSNKGLAHISWTSVADSGLSGYNVYRKIKGETALSKVNTATILEARYQDKSVEIGKTYVYAVTWVGKTAKESAKSSEFEVFVEKTANQSGFADVPDTAWYKDHVIQLTTNKIVSGYVDGSFRPNHNVSRGEFAKMMCLTMGWTLENPSSASFTDVPKDHWAYKYIETAKSKKVIAGYEDGTFKPGKSITRAEIAKIASETLGLPAGASTLSDIATSWANDYIAKCVKANIVGGYNDNTFRPSNTATRAEAAKMVVGVLGAKK
ncbi:MAG: Ig-like domain-containing protein [Actinobacteria bacterium]|nr:Ig-like domain-containing protein [Actinomycetota bacterium]